MRSLSAMLLLLALAVGVPTAQAAHYSDVYVIPVAGRTAGAAGTFWMSDVAIHNFQSSPLTVDFIFIESGEGKTDNVRVIQPGGQTVTVPARGSVMLRDVLRDTGSSFGALIIGANQPFAVTSRAYSMSPGGNTIGQTITPARDFFTNATGRTDNAMATAYLPGVVQTAQYRTNVGFVAGTSNLASSMQVEFTVRNANGQSAGSRTFTIGPGAFTHVQFPLATITTQNLEAAAVEVRITQGDGAVVPYASVIDNTTGDAVFVSGQFPPNTTISGFFSASPFHDLLFRAVR